MFYSDMDELEEAMAAIELPNGVKSEEFVAMYMGCQYVQNLLEEAGIQWRGYSYKAGVPVALLVVKGTIEDAPVVVFTSGRDLTNCFRIFFRMLREDFLQWVPDRFG